MKGEDLAHLQLLHRLNSIILHIERATLTRKGRKWHARPLPAQPPSVHLAVGVLYSLPCGPPGNGMSILWMFFRLKDSSLSMTFKVSVRTWGVVYGTTGTTGN